MKNRKLLIAVLKNYDNIITEHETLNCECNKFTEHECVKCRQIKYYENEFNKTLHQFLGEE